MKTYTLLKPHVSSAVTFIVASLLSVPVGAQVPDTLKHSIPAPGGVQSDTRLGDSVAVEGAYTVVTVPRVFNGTTGEGDLLGSGAVKVFDTTSGRLLHVLPNPVLAEDEDFGSAVAISGTRAVVGAMGKAYVFDFAGANPANPVLTLNSPVMAPEDYVASSVGISGMHVVVGYRAEGSSVTESGTAYVYDLSSATPTAPVVTLTDPSPTAGDRFGSSVAISGSRVLVGAPGKDAGANESGSAFVYDIKSAMPSSPVTSLHNPSPGAGDNFGTTVAISGMRVVVGAGLDDTQGVNAGSAYVYDLSAAIPTVPVATLNNPGAGTAKQFGSSVAIAGARIVVGGGLPGDQNVPASAYVFEVSGATPTVPVATLSSPLVGDEFGFSVAISGTQVVVGAPGDDLAEPDTGTAYAYDLGGAAPEVAIATLRSPTPSPKDRFGRSVAISGMHLVVGAAGSPESGRVSIYDLGSGMPTVPVATLYHPAPYGIASFGHSVAIAGGRVIVGASSYST